MDWVSGLSDVLKQYNGARPDQAPDTVEDDFDQFANAAPPSAVADGLAEAFRSEQTPPFPNMLGQIFRQSSGTQRASILNTLLATLGPSILSQVLARGGGGGAGTGAGGGGIGGMLEQILGSGQKQITPEQAEQIPPEAVEQVAAEAERQNPSIIDRVSDIYAQNPTLIKTLGAAALTVALAKIASRNNPMT